MSYVVRTDIGSQPYWICDHWLYSEALDMTPKPGDALRFSCPEQASRVADKWSDVPGVWRVVVRPKTVSS